MTNRHRHGSGKSLVGIIAGTKAKIVIAALRHIPEFLLDGVEEVTFDLPDSMQKIVRSCFREVFWVIHQFHIQKLACEAIQKTNDQMEEAGFHSFNVIAATFYEHYDDILNFYNKRSPNAVAESFNATIKQFRTTLRRVVD